MSLKDEPLKIDERGRATRNGHPAVTVVDPDRWQLQFTPIPPSAPSVLQFAVIKKEEK